MGYRILLDDDGNQIRLLGAGMTICPECESEAHISWLNYNQFATWYWANVGDGGCGGEVKRRAT